MKNFLGLVILVLISSCKNSTNEISIASKIPDFSGKWNWTESSGFGNRGFSLNIIQKNDSIYGIFDAYAQGGNRIDQGIEIIQDYNIIGIVKNNVAYLKFASAWSDDGELGEATLVKKSDLLLEWKITKRPKTNNGDFWIIDNCTLKQK